MGRLKQSEVKETTKGPFVSREDSGPLVSCPTGDTRSKYPCLLSCPAPSPLSPPSPRHVHPTGRTNTLLSEVYHCWLVWRRLTGSYRSHRDTGSQTDAVPLSVVPVPEGAGGLWADPLPEFERGAEAVQPSESHAPVFTQRGTLQVCNDLLESRKNLDWC